MVYNQVSSHIKPNGKPEFSHNIVKKRLWRDSPLAIDTSTVILKLSESGPF